MDLNYVLHTLLKILISTPAIWLICCCGPSGSHGAALLSDGSGTSRNLTNVSAPYYDYEFSDSQELEEEPEPELTKNSRQESEEIPDPSALVLPGYNLPENIFNHGKPFYVEKDPLTGNINFQQKTPTTKIDEDMYEYDDEPPSSNIYDKANIDRKDGSLSSHRPSDVNQLIPNFHDFLNLPVKYNSAKYVYPLISNSYASTKYQGSVNKFHNHKGYLSKTTKKPLVSPTYYSTEKYFKITYATTTPTTTTTPKSTTTTQKQPETTKIVNLLNTGMGIGFSEEFDDYYDSTIMTTTRKPSTTTTTSTTTKRPTSKIVPSTTEPYRNVLTTNKMPNATTKKVLTLFEQLFGEYEDDPVTSTTRSTTEQIKFKKTTEKPSTTTTSTTSTASTSTTKKYIPKEPVSSTEPDFSYEYEDVDDNIAVESKLVASTNEGLKIEPLKIVTSDRSVEITTQKTIKRTDYEQPEDTFITTTPRRSFVTPPPAIKVTSLPLGQNHLTTSGYEPFKHREPIIVATQNLREKLNSEKVAPRPFEKPSMPSQNNVHIPHDQNSVSFVLGNQQSVDGGYYGTALKENPYDSNPFRPYYGVNVGNDEKEITLQGTLSFPSESVGSAVTIQPQRNSEASLAIGVPVSGINKQTPGQVLDEKLEINSQQLGPREDIKISGNKIVFPNNKQPEYPDFMPPPREPVQPNREILQLSSHPMLHQLPSDLTPPREQEPVAPKRPYSRPPWDPRPGHFYSGNPEYNRPPRPQTDVPYKRIDNLPNVLPQFRPNTSHMNKSPPNYYDKKLNRQPLLDRPSNRPISFFEKLHPPPPPPPLFLTHKNLPVQRNKIGSPPRQSLDEDISNISEDRLINDDHPGMYQTPPQVKIANRRTDTDVTEVETLQMIQAKSAEKKNKDTALVQSVVNVQADEGIKENTEKTIYKVYPVNSTPIKLDVIDDSNKKESVVIGTRSERPLPPSKINQDFDLLFDSKDRNDDPILKPHKPPAFPIKSDFPYPLERPGLEPTLNLIPVPDTPSKNDLDESDYFSNNQWNTIGDNYEPKIVNTQKITGINQISVTLKTHTDRPIAVAYTPTEPNLVADKYSMPNYGSPVIPEIRPGDSNKVFTVSATMHTNHQSSNRIAGNVDRADVVSNHKNDVDVPDYPKLDFEAPFQASLNIENTMNQGWSVVVKNKNSTTTEPSEATTLPYATTSEFDIQNFKPQLEGGFKPIFNFPDDDKKFVETKMSDRDE